MSGLRIKDGPEIRQQNNKKWSFFFNAYYVFVCGIVCACIHDDIRIYALCDGKSVGPGLGSVGLVRAACKQCAPARLKCAE